MNSFDHQWRKLTALARSAPAEAGAAAPYGFATRVAAQGLALPAAPWISFERFALRGLAVATVFSLAAFAFDFASASSEQPYSYSAGTAAIDELLDFS